MTDDIMDKLPDEELTDEEHEALLLKSEHAIGPPLSPAALAVLNAARQYEINPECYSREIAATTLRTAADQVVPTDTLYARSCCEFTGDSIRNALLAIAYELEAE